MGGTQTAENWCVGAGAGNPELLGNRSSPLEPLGVTRTHLEVKRLGKNRTTGLRKYYCKRKIEIRGQRTRGEPLRIHRLLHILRKLALRRCELGLLRSHLLKGMREGSLRGDGLCVRMVATLHFSQLSPTVTEARTAAVRAGVVAKPSPLGDERGEFEG